MSNKGYEQERPDAACDNHLMLNAIRSGSYYDVLKTGPRKISYTNWNN